MAKKKPATRNMSCPKRSADDDGNDKVSRMMGGYYSYYRPQWQWWNNLQVLARLDCGTTTGTGIVGLERVEPLQHVEQPLLLLFC
ncbi:hypothetical protein BaRGS_00020564 [Batillaria attramentaria]|uniref:Uncharacterized protein n=1 Tax=Batillaria attramentaria TaxID=370345 RepID=A0ABD0KMD3_9CAEN